MERIFKNNKISTEEKYLNVGLYLGFTFIILVIAYCVTYYIKKQNLNGLFHSYMIYISLPLSIFYLITSFFPTRLIKTLQVIMAILIGFFLVVTYNFTAGSHDTVILNGEIFIVLAIMTGKMYGVVKKNFTLASCSLILLCFISKFVLFSSEINNNTSGYISYIFLGLFYTIFFLIVIFSRDRQLTGEAEVICTQWKNEQVYSDIGKSVFSNFMHDYHTDHAISHLEVLKSIIIDGSKEEAIELTTELQQLLTTDHENILRVKEKIRLSEKSSPCSIDIYSVVEDKIKYYKKAYNLQDGEIQAFYKIDTPYQLYMIPLDFIGIIENLIKNAIEASDELKKIQILIKVYNKGCYITVKNRGKNIPWANEDGIVPLDSFRVGRTTKQSGSGWGVFSTIKRICDNKGKVKIYSKNSITEFYIKLPIKKEILETSRV